MSQNLYNPCCLTSIYVNGAGYSPFKGALDPGHYHCNLFKKNIRLECSFRLFFVVLDIFSDNNENKISIQRRLRRKKQERYSTCWPPKIIKGADLKADQANEYTNIVPLNIN
jgi:hypothetical protein